LELRDNVPTLAELLNVSPRLVAAVKAVERAEILRVCWESDS
jgi:hypothetical protein